MRFWLNVWNKLTNAGDVVVVVTLRLFLFPGRDNISQDAQAGREGEAAAVTEPDAVKEQCNILGKVDRYLFLSCESRPPKIQLVHSVALKAVRRCAHSIQASLRRENRLFFVFLHHLIFKDNITSESGGSWLQRSVKKPIFSCCCCCCCGMSPSCCSAPQRVVNSWYMGHVQVRPRSDAHPPPLFAYQSECTPPSLPDSLTHPPSPPWLPWRQVFGKKCLTENVLQCHCLMLQRCDSCWSVAVTLIDDSI